MECGDDGSARTDRVLSFECTATRPWSGWPGGFGPGGPGRGGIGVLRGVELTEEQRASIKAIHEAERSGRDARGGTDGRAGAQAHRELQAEIFADSPDPQKIATLQQQIEQAQSEALAQRTATMQKVAQVLTAEQRAGIRNRLSRSLHP